MENVKGILTKDEGRIKERIIREIRSIVDDMKMSQLFAFLDDTLKPMLPMAIYESIYLRLNMETTDESLDKTWEMYFNNLDQQLKDVTKNLPYNVSKSDESVNTVRHGLILLKMRQQRESISNRLFS